jgi:hypothetical protein
MFRLTCRVLAGLEPTILWFLLFSAFLIEICDDEKSCGVFHFEKSEIWIPANCQKFEVLVKRFRSGAKFDTQG